MTDVKNVKVEPAEIKKSAGKAKAQGAGDFNSFLGALDAMQPMNEELMYQATGSSNAASILHGAFTGMSGAAGSYGYGGGASGAGFGTGYGGFGSLSEYPGMMGSGGAATYTGYAGGMTAGAGKAVSTGADTGTGLPTGELLNTMNVNNLKLLELQAVMQSNMQAWNTKSNVLSADHRARMAMIEKFTAR